MGGKSLIYGIGVNDLNERVKIDGKNLKVYDCWRQMLGRCYDPKYQSKQPTYIGCSVSEDWLYLSNFKKFYDLNYKDGYQLDKDILYLGNKIYSPETCVFVPNYLNSLLVDCGASRGNMPLGITKRIDYFRTKPYRAQCSNGHRKQIYNSFKNISEAQNWYIETKKQVVLQQIERAKKEGFDNEAVFEALLNRNWK